jgi:hypothetical protein
MNKLIRPYNLIYHNLQNVITLNNKNIIIDVARIIDFDYYTRYNYSSKYHEIYIEYYENKKYLYSNIYYSRFYEKDYSKFLEEIKSINKKKLLVDNLIKIKN